MATMRRTMMTTTMYVFYFVYYNTKQSTFFKNARIRATPPNDERVIVRVQLKIVRRDQATL
jgi:hypothetical protein